MRMKEAKEVAIPDLLALLGHYPDEKRSRPGGEQWYASPLRDETTPSFKVSRDGRLWYDHGIGQGGTIIELLMARFDTDESGALRALEQLLNVPAPQQQSVAFTAGSEATAAEPEPIIITALQPVTHPELKRYLRERGIPPDAALPYLAEMHYQRGEKPYFTLAFANRTGGYELRNAYFKGVHGHKDITLLRPDGEGGTTDDRPLTAPSVAVFEGFMDFLSAVVITGRAPRMPVIVMNSTALKERTLDAIYKLGVQTVYLYLDRDAAGQRLTAEIQAALPDLLVQDRSVIYAGYTDLNDFHRATVKQETAAFAR
jgi:DNA primase